MINTSPASPSIEDDRLEGPAALDLYAAQIESNLTALHEQAALLCAVLTERKEMLRRMRRNTRAARPAAI
jgi:hypothetical protein